MRLSLKAWILVGLLLACLAGLLGLFALAPAYLTPWLQARLDRQAGLNGRVGVASVSPWGATLAPLQVSSDRMDGRAETLVLATDPFRLYQGLRGDGAGAPFETVGVHGAAIDIDLRHWGPWAPPPVPPPMPPGAPSIAEPETGRTPDLPGEPSPEADVDVPGETTAPTVETDPAGAEAEPEAIVEEPAPVRLPMDRLVLTPTRLHVRTGPDAAWSGRLSGRLERSDAGGHAAEGVFQLRSLAPGEGLDALVEGEGRLDGSQGRLLAVVEARDPLAAWMPWKPPGLRWPPDAWEVSAGALAIQARAAWEGDWQAMTLSATASAGPLTLAVPAAGASFSWQQAALAVQGEPFGGFPGWLPGPVRGSLHFQEGTVRFDDWMIDAGLSGELSVTPDATTRLRLTAPRLTGPGVDVRQPEVVLRLDGPLGSPGLFDKRLEAQVNLDRLALEGREVGPLDLRVLAEASRLEASWRNNDTDTPSRLEFDGGRAMDLSGVARLLVKRGLGNLSIDLDAEVGLEPDLPGLQLEGPADLDIKLETDAIAEWKTATALASLNLPRLRALLLTALSGDVVLDLPAGRFDEGAERPIRWSQGRLALRAVSASPGPRLEWSGQWSDLTVDAWPLQAARLSGNWPAVETGSLSLSGTWAGLAMEARLTGLPGWQRTLARPESVDQASLRLLAQTGETGWSPPSGFPGLRDWRARGSARLTVPRIASLTASAWSDPEAETALRLDLSLDRLEAPEDWDLVLSQLDARWEQQLAGAATPRTPDGAVSFSIESVQFRGQPLGRLDLSGKLERDARQFALDGLVLAGDDLAARLAPVTLPLSPRAPVSIEIRVDRLDLSQVSAWLPDWPVSLAGTVAGSLQLERRSGNWWPVGGRLALIPETGGRLSITEAGLLTDLLNRNHPRYRELRVAEDALQDLRLDQLVLQVDPPAYPDKAFLVYLAGRAELPARPAREGRPAQPARTINLELPIPIGMDGPLESLLRKWLEGELDLSLER
ncbi:MAG: hypothetical protein ACFE0O_01745 [Opitutales bacterium]